MDPVPAIALVDRSGLSYRQVDHWIRKGHIHVVGDQHPGSGNGAREVTRDEAEAVTYGALLVRYGVGPRLAMHLGRELVAGRGARLGPFNITLED